VGLHFKQGSLNAGVSSRKGRGGPNLDQQVRQLGQRPRVELLYGADERMPETGIGESFTQPMELLDGPVPRQGIGQAALIAELLLYEVPLVSRANGDPGIELLGIASQEIRVGSDFDPCEQRLRPGRLETCVPMQTWGPRFLGTRPSSTGRQEAGEISDDPAVAGRPPLWLAYPWMIGSAFIRGMSA
jgi:hypothetical protein